MKEIPDPAKFTFWRFCGQNRGFQALEIPKRSQIAQRVSPIEPQSNSTIFRAQKLLLTPPERRDGWIYSNFHSHHWFIYKGKASQTLLTLWAEGPKKSRVNIFERAKIFFWRSNQKSLAGSFRDIIDMYCHRFLESGKMSELTFFSRH